MDNRKDTRVSIFCFQFSINSVTPFLCARVCLCVRVRVDVTVCVHGREFKEGIGLLVQNFKCQKIIFLQKVKIVHFGLNLLAQANSSCGVYIAVIPV